MRKPAEAHTFAENDMQQSDLNLGGNFAHRTFNESLMQIIPGGSTMDNRQKALIIESEQSAGTT